jgi:hypothetical protein
MNLTSTAVDLANALKAVNLAWEEVREGWKDAVSRDFEAHQLTPLRDQTQAVLQAMDRLSPVLAKALRDCAS